MGKKFKKLKLKLNRIMPILMMAIALFLATSISAEALHLLEESGGYYDKDEKEYVDQYVYGNEYRDVYGASAEMNVEKEHNIVGDILHGAGNLLESFISPFIYAIAELLNWIIKNGQFDLSLDSIVYGRVASTRQMTIDMSHFGLEQNNPYGVIGASLYVLLKRASYAIIPVVIMVLLLINLFRNNRKGREQLKDLATNTVFYFITIELMPYIVELYIYVRDFFMFFVKKGLAEVSGNSVVNMTDELWSLMEYHYNRTFSIIIALLMVAVAFAGFFYLWDYVKIALLLAVTFGLFPIIVLLMYFKPKIVSDWFDLLTPNLLIPFIDGILLMAPTIILAVVEGALGISNLSNDGKSLGIDICIVLLCCIFAVKGIRNIILKKLFHYEGGTRDGGLGMLVLMAARSMGTKSSTASSTSAGPGGGGSGGTAASGESTAKAEEASESGKVMEDADKLIDGDEDATGSSFASDSSAGFTDAELESQDVSAVEAEEMATAGVDEVPEEMEEMPEGETLDEVPEEMEEMPDRESFDETPGNAGDDATGSVADNNEPVTEDIPGNTEEGALNDGDVASQSRVSTDAPGSSSTGVNGDSNTALSKMRDSDEFANLSERDQKRFENLARMDELEANIAKNNKIMTDSGYSKGAYEKAVARDSEYSRKMEKLNQEREHLQEKREILEQNGYDASDDRVRAEYDKNMEQIRDAEERNTRDMYEVQGAQLENRNYINNMQDSYNADRANMAYQQQVDRCKAVERQYAQNSGLGGMSTKTYNNASDFFNQKRVEQIQKRQADYRNFDSGRFNGILSPQERENFYRERAAQQRRDEISQKAKGVGKVVGGTLGAAAGVYGGAGAMVAGGMIGSAVVGWGAEKASGVGRGNKDNDSQRSYSAEKNTHAEAEQVQRETSAQAERTFMRNEQNAGSGNNNSGKNYYENTEANMNAGKKEGVNFTHSIRND